MDIQALKSDIATLHVKLDHNFEKYMEKLVSIETQTLKTNGRVTGHDAKLETLEKEHGDKFNNIHKILYTAIGGGGALLLIPSLQQILSKILN